MSPPARSFVQRLPRATVEAYHRAAFTCCVGVFEGATCDGPQVSGAAQGHGVGPAFAGEQQGAASFAYGHQAFVCGAQGVESA
ncbi:MAG: hypothetical protein JRH20_04065 [Deltaproteobacteria bacterium]|nr:hypothetical protein [Deltaproteobacteria bacterium]